MRTEQTRGLFLSLEGIEGSGKSSHRDRLADRLRKAGVPVLVTREPGGTPLGEAIRPLLLAVDGDVPEARAELFLMLASRAQHVERVLLPALAEGRVILCDRYADASLAYQGGARGLGVTAVREANQLATGGLVPDLTLLFDLPVPTALERAHGRTGKVTDRFDREETAFHETVRATYLELAAEDPVRFRILDADRPPEAVAAAVWAEVEPRLQKAREEGALG